MTAVVVAFFLGNGDRGPHTGEVVVDAIVVYAVIDYDRVLSREAVVVSVVNDESASPCLGKCKAFLAMAVVIFVVNDDSAPRLGPAVARPAATFFVVDKAPLTYR